MAETSLNPHIAGDFSPLDILSMDALETWGEGEPGVLYPSVARMFMRFANSIIEDVKAHPYWDNDANPLDYYKSLTQTRVIPDMIMIAGLLHYYAVQQTSTKTQTYGPLYYKTMNRVLHNVHMGNTGLRLSRVDGSHDATVTSDAAEAAAALAASSE